MTGTNVGKHGIYNFETMVPGNGSFVATDSRMRANLPFWGLLSRQGKKAVVINVVGTYPPDKINGAVISGKPVPKGVRCYTYPEDLTTGLDRAGYFPSFSRPYRSEGEYLERVRKIASVAKEMLARNDWDCFVLVVTETDGFQHSYPGDLKKIEAFYEAMDAVMGEFVEGIGAETTVIICSDHGHGPSTHSFHIERFLYQRGFLSLKDDRELLRPVPWAVWKTSGNASKLKFALFNATRILELMGLQLKWPRLRDWIEAKERELMLDPIDWRRTVAFRTKRDGSTANSGGLRLYKRNIGIRSSFEVEREEIISRLKRKLLEVKDPETGGRVVDAVWTKEELYSGPMLDRIPDLILRTRPQYHCVRYQPHSSNIRDPRLVERYRKPKRFHAEEGVLILSGRGIRSGVVLKPTIFDIAPMILYLLGCPVPSYMDGKVLTEALEGGFLADYPIHIVEEDGNLFKDKDYDFGDSRPLADEIREELVRLGYE
jgi:predicted AlkP superfamily phosphohydrolase/phosphomutase